MKLFALNPLIKLSPEETTLIDLNINIKNKHYANSDIEVLAQLELTVKCGEFVAIIGPSGCGKTTLLNMISGTETSEGQSISFNSHNERDSKLERLGYIFQQPRLMSWFTVRENIELVLPKSQHHEVDDLLLSVGLEGKGEFFPSQLSGGMQRRVSIARAFAINPQLLLLDEPFNSLDVPTANKLRQLLIDLCKKSGTTVVFVTHDLQEACYLADRIVFLSDMPTRIIHQCAVDKCKQDNDAGLYELELQTQLLTIFPNLLAGRID